MLIKNQKGFQESFNAPQPINTASRRERANQPDM
jgi:hypothetical protein